MFCCLVKWNNYSNYFQQASRLLRANSCEEALKDIFAGGGDVFSDIVLTVARCESGYQEGEDPPTTS